jgi:hypothetical protein
LDHPVLILTGREELSPVGGYKVKVGDECIVNQV